MRNIQCFIFALFLAVPFMHIDAFAGGGSPDELAELKAQVRALQQKIDSMSGSAPSGDVSVSLKKGTGLTFKSSDGNYKLRMRLRGQFLATYENTADVDDDEELAFRIRRLRWTWDGNVFTKWMKYKVQLDLSDGDAELKDMIFDFAYNKALVPRVGQYKVPFNREVQNSSSALQLVGRSILNDAFEYDRDVGLGIHGSDGKFWKYELMLGNGEGPVTRERDDIGLLWAGRIMVAPMGGTLKVKPNMAKETTLQIGAAIAGLDVEDISTEATNFDPISDRFSSLGIVEGQVTSITGDISFATPMFNLEAEYNGRWISDDDPALSDSVYDQGFRVQGGVFLLPKKLEAAARWAYVDLDDDVDGDFDNQWAITPGINYYLSGDHRWKIQLDYSFIRTEEFGGDEVDDNVIQAQVQAYF